MFANKRKKFCHKDWHTSQTANAVRNVGRKEFSLIACGNESRPAFLEYNVDFPQNSGN